MKHPIQLLAWLSTYVIEQGLKGEINDIWFDIKGDGFSSCSFSKINGSLCKL